MMNGGKNGQKEQSIPLVSDRNRPLTSQYVDLTLVPERPSQPRAMFNKKLGARIDHRKHLLLRRKWLVDLTLSVAVMGIVLMVVENELYYLDKSEKSSMVSIMLKLFVSVSTALLLIGICLYYHTGAEIKMLDAKVDDPLAVTSSSTWICLLIELLVCAIHPFPGNTEIYMATIYGGADHAHLDGILSVLMMFRLYLVGRFLVVHSSLLTDKSTQTISAVSHVKIDLVFVFKAAMSEHPGKVIAFTMISMFSISVWAMRTCELYYTDITDIHSLTESMWLSAITFLTVGYGDLTPKTHCGRFVSVLTGLMGLASTALLVAVVAKKMEQNCTERYVYNYLSMIHLERKRKNIAADVIKFTVKVYICKKACEREQTRRRRMNLTYFSWRLSNSIRAMRSTRVARCRVEEASVGLTELSQQVSQTQSLIAMLATTQGQILDKLTDLQERVKYKEEEDVYSNDEATTGDEVAVGRSEGQVVVSHRSSHDGWLSRLYRRNSSD
ncbi:potassium intermediate small conductance calcium-activated channel, sub N, member 3 [Bulinus truncatus]|nr:potassium intermediate small conductance calcium-activated channel, sub N, member 3 [Bulinus truncatus]